MHYNTVYEVIYCLTFVELNEMLLETQDGVRCWSSCPLSVELSLSLSPSDSDTRQQVSTKTLSVSEYTCTCHFQQNLCVQNSPFSENYLYLFHWTITEREIE